MIRLMIIISHNNTISTAIEYYYICTYMYIIITQINKHLLGKQSLHNSVEIGRVYRFKFALDLDFSALLYTNLCWVTMQINTYV